MHGKYIRNNKIHGTFDQGFFELIIVLDTHALHLCIADKIIFQDGSVDLEFYSELH